jgi:hypothetical protein
VWIVSTVVVVIALALVAALSSGSERTEQSVLAPAALVRKVTSVPVSVFTRVGAGTAVATPKPITAPALTAGGKPQIVYIGAEYCPSCATERWPIVLALSRFGSFTGLRLTHSSDTGRSPITATFSFHGAAYRSRWIAFAGVETRTNQRRGNGYAPLDRLTAAQRRLFATYDAPPYTDSSGGIPFIDFGGKFLVRGVTYDPSVLTGKSPAAIADAFADPTTSISKGAIGAANALTATICLLTHDQPASVCAEPTIRQLESSLG